MVFCPYKYLYAGNDHVWCGNVYKTPCMLVVECILILETPGWYTDMSHSRDISICIYYWYAFITFLLQHITKFPTVIQCTVHMKTAGKYETDCTKSPIHISYLGVCVYKEHVIKIFVLIGDKKNVFFLENVQFFKKK